jgi:processive 1,2-diacylglycerol beta-glucosyltransferase
MPELYLKSTNKHLGHITEDDLKFLIAQLEEESEDDEDYAISRMTLDYMKGQRISPNLLTLLEEALGEADEVEVKFTRS